jgi:DNA replication protein DnaC
VPLLLKELKDGFHQLGEQSYSIRLNQLCNIPLLVLDDLGVEKSTDWGREQLQTIIDYRSMNALSIVVTSNKRLDEIVGNDTEDARLASMRIGSRLRRESWCRVVMMDSSEYNRPTSGRLT